MHLIAKRKRTCVYQAFDTGCHPPCYKVLPCRHLPHCLPRRRPCEWVDQLGILCLQLCLLLCYQHRSCHREWLNEAGFPHQKTGISEGKGALMIFALWKNLFLCYISSKFWSTPPLSDEFCKFRANPLGLPFELTLSWVKLPRMSLTVLLKSFSSDCCAFSLLILVFGPCPASSPFKKLVIADYFCLLTGDTEPN